MLELLFELISEIVLQIVFEVLLEIGLRPFRGAASRSPIFAAIGYMALGAGAGAVSLIIFPRLFLTSQGARITNLIVTPLIAGLVMSALGAWKKSRQHELLRLDQFGYGAVFAFGMAIVRFCFGK